VGKLLSFLHAELLPIAVNAGQTAKPPKPDEVESLSDRLSKALQEAWFERIIDRFLSVWAKSIPMSTMRMRI